MEMQVSANFQLLKPKLSKNLDKDILSINDEYKNRPCMITAWSVCFEIKSFGTG